MTLDRRLCTRLEAALGGPLDVVRAVGGGSIHAAWCVRVGGERLFVKTSPDAPAGMFAAEAHGLGRLAACDAIRVPEVIHVDPEALVLEWIDLRAADPGFGPRLGEALASLHGITSPTFGLDRDNWIGRLAQPNAPAADWHAFYVDHRLGAQLAEARRTGALPTATVARVEGVAERWAELVPAPSAPALLHGDLWGGNHGMDGAGRPVLYDPAAYFGHPESELGFTTLFGGFPAGFHAAWERASGLGDAWRDREPLHHLYPLLVHANLFGGHYVSAVDRIARRYAGRG